VKKRELQEHIRTIANKLAEEEREKMIENAFSKFVAQTERSFHRFRADVMVMIKRPSDHEVQVKVGDKTYSMTTTAHVRYTCLMTHQVIDRVCKVLVSVIAIWDRQKQVQRNH
jgi:hypothetical protein